ncbi:MAG TPA: hypothetical protein PLS81_03155 [Deltaproteobacteria bacterium]|nr:hypothetical protein [Deltaproteobacteria bacterium]HOM28437.1 hypothetical protein [Deltaproteobacteria bacterium]HPP81324.1 hypothetical protein [Deltaproteobacteria bacterium]
MMTVTCPTCGKKIVWDDFQPLEIKCSKCGERLNLHREFRRNIEIREHGLPGRRFSCPRCRTVISRRWFVKCPGCNYWVFGPFVFYDKLAAALLIGIAYVVFSAIYLIYFH